MLSLITPDRLVFAASPAKSGFIARRLVLVLRLVNYSQNSTTFGRGSGDGVGTGQGNRH